MAILVRDKQKFNKEVANSALLDEITDNPLDQEKLRLELDGNIFIIHVLPKEKSWKHTYVTFNNINLRDIIEDNDIKKLIIKCHLQLEVEFRTNLDYYDYKDFPIEFDTPKEIVIFSKTGRLIK